MTTTAYLPQPGDIGLVPVKGDEGILIRVGQWLNGSGFANFEHCFVHVGRGLIVEAEPGGAREVPLTEYDGRAIVWLRCPPQYGNAVAQAAQTMIGTPYSWADYGALAAHRLHLPAPGLKTYIGDSGHMICSQLCDEAARRGGWVLFTDGRWPGYVVPADLYRLAQEQRNPHSEVAG